MASFVNFSFSTIKTDKPYLIANIFTFGREDIGWYKKRRAVEKHFVSVYN